LKKTHHKKRAGGVAQGIDPEFKHQYYKKKKKKKKFLEVKQESDRRASCLFYPHHL
jgi:hypothetical protein